MLRVNYLLALNKRIVNVPIDVIGNLPNPIILEDTYKHKLTGQRYDLVVGNPPWGVMRYIRNEDYKEFLKEEAFKFQILSRNEMHLFSQLEIAALFFCMTVDKYLHKNGIVGYIMPKSVIMGTKHLKLFREFRNPLIKISKILDLQYVKPLFGNPACVLIGVRGKKTEYPVKIQHINASIPNNATFKDLKLNIKDGEYYDPRPHNMQKSWYYSKFKTGASIFPRTLYFVDIETESNKYIRINTSQQIKSKAPWTGFNDSGKISSEFLFYTLLPVDMVPFAYTRLRPVILPITNSNSDVTFNILTLEDLDPISIIWFNKTENYWKNNYTKRSAKLFPKLNKRLDYNGLLSRQDTSKRYILLQAADGTNLCACIIDRKQIKKKFHHDFIADVKTWIFESNSLSELNYLCSILNSNTLNKLIKPLQPHGLGGPRAINRTPLEFPIPRFDRSNNLHQEMSQFSKIAHDEVKKLNLSSLSNQRKFVRIELKDTLNIIDGLVDELLIDTR